VDPGWRNHDKSGCAFLISHSTLTKTAYLSSLAKHAALKRVFFIHDTIPCDYPEFCRALGGLKHLLRIRNTFRYATHVVVNSEYTKARLEHWRKRLGEKELPVKVIPIGVDDGLLGHARHDVRPTVSKRPYFVILGTIEPRKNHAMLLDVWMNFAKTLPPDRIPELIIVGRRGWKNKAVFRMLDQCEPLRGHVREMNSVSDAELWPLLRGARAMLFPSFVEGWGMPLIEALTLGVPVIGSDIDAFKEAGQGVPELLPVSDSDLWAARIMDYSGDESSARRAQLERIPNFSPPTWQRHFESLERMLACDS
jgi:glycosyltransferase involved in cell wall biosynthesis